AVAAEHDADDVLADVVYVAFDGGKKDAAGTRPARGPAKAGHYIRSRIRRLLLFHERFEVGDGAFHRAGALDDLRQEHLAGAEGIADRLHAVHQRAFDPLERPAELLARFFGVGFDEVHHSVDEREGEALFDRLLTPGKIELALLP